MKKTSWSVAAAVLAVSGIAGAQQASDYMAAQMQSFASAQAPGQAPVMPLGSAMLVQGQGTSYAVQMQGGRCYSILALGGPGVVDVDTALYDPTGKKVESDSGFDAQPKLQHCAKWPGAYRVDVKVKKGGGEVVTQVFAPGGAQPVAAAPPPQAHAPVAAPPPPANDPLAGAVEAQARQNAPGAVRVGDFLRGVAPKQNGFTDWYVNLDQGRCYTVVGAGGMGVEYLSLYLWAPNGSRVSDVKPKTPWASLPYCAPMSGPYHVQAKAAKGAGELRAGIYVNP